MKKKFILLSLFLIVQNLSAGEIGLPTLLFQKIAPNQSIGWQWRLAAHGKIYPFLRREANQLFFLDPDGKVLAQAHYLPYSKIVVSPDRALVGFLDVDEQYQVPEDMKGPRGLRYHITSFSGEEKYTIPLQIPYDDPVPALYLNSAGQAILLDGSSGLVQLFGSDGAAIKEIDLFGDDVPDYEKPIACAVADDAGVFAILAQKRPLTVDETSGHFISGEPTLFCFSFDGTELLRKPLELMTAAEVAISRSGKFVVISQYSPNSDKKSTLMNMSGQILLEVPMLFRYAKFSPDDSLLVLADKKSAFFIDLQSRSYFATKLIADDADRMIAALSLSEASNELLVLIARAVFQHGQFEYTAPEVVKLNPKGELVWKLKFHQQKFLTPSFFGRSDYFGIGFDLSYKIFRE